MQQRLRQGWQGRTSLLWAVFPPVFPLRAESSGLSTGRVAGDRSEMDLRGAITAAKMPGMRQDIREAFRRLRQQPLLSAATVVVLTCAIGAVTAVVAVADAVLLRPLPYPNAERIAVLWEANPRQQTLVELSYPDILDWQRENRSFDDLAAMGSVNWSHRLTGIGDPENVAYAAVSGTFFRVMGSAPVLGRVFNESDDVPNAARVAVVSHGFWQGRLGGDAKAVGRTITLDGASFEVVGVMSSAFDYPSGAELWTALVPELDFFKATQGFDAATDRSFGILFAVGRLRSQVFGDAARQDLDRVNAAIDQHEGARDPRPVVLTSLEDRLLGATRPALWLLLAGVVVILAICAANVATLLLMRAMATHHETAVRLALGATWTQMFRLRLAEALLLFGGALTAGLWAAWVALPMVMRLAPESVYRISDATISVGVVAAVTALVGLAAIVSSLAVTAVSLARARRPDALASEGRSVSRSRAGTVQGVLVAGQCALALMLLTAGGLTVESLRNLRSLDLGFDPTGTLTLEVLPSPRLEKQANRDFYSPLMDQLNGIPGVAAVGAAYLRPLAYDGVGMNAHVLAEGHDPDDNAAWEAAVITNREVVTPGFFTAMGTPVSHGRAFTDGDTEQSQPVAILGATAARRLFPSGSALGHQIVGDAGPDGKPRWRTVVGVVADVRYRGLQDVRADLYIPHRQLEDAVKHVIVRSHGSPMALLASVRERVRQVDPQAVIGAVTTMDAVVERAMAPWRLYMVLFSVLGGLALLMTVVGIYATVRYAVVDRWREWGIRAALGASAQALTNLVLRQSLTPVLLGAGMGFVVALGLGRAMRSILVGAPGIGLLASLAAVLFLLLAALSAYLPGRAARRADPATLLRSV